jgi:hypothetical protein
MMIHRTTRTLLAAALLTAASATALTTGASAMASPSAGQDDQTPSYTCDRLSASENAATWDSKTVRNPMVQPTMHPGMAPSRWTSSSSAQPAKSAGPSSAM